jgi:hypothetical protein
VKDRADELVESRGIATAASFSRVSAESTLGNDVLSEFYD